MKTTLRITLTYVISILLALAVLIPLVGIASASSTMTTNTRGEHILHAPPLPPVPTLPPPPPGFTPLTATDADLAKYGFPRRPSNPSSAATWRYAMAHAKYYVPPSIDNSISAAPVGSPGLVTSNTIYSNKAAGYIATNIFNDALTSETFAIWTQTSVFPTQPKATLATWTGIEGPTPAPTGSVVQAGTFAFTTNPPSYSFFYEDYPLDPVIITNTIQPVPGDETYVDVVYIRSSQDASYYWQDITTGKYTMLTKSAPYYDGSYGDYVIETKGSPLPASLNIPFNDCNLVWYTSNTNGENTLGSLQNTKVIMTDSGTITGTVLVSTTVIGPDLQSFSLLRGPQ